MPLKLVKRKSKYWYLRGTVRGIAVDESTGTDKRDLAESIRIQRESEIEHRSIYGARATASFLEAAVSYMEQKDKPRFLRPLIEHFGTTRLCDIDQAAIDRAARLLYPNASPATRNRQVYTPVSAVLSYAARRKLCEPMRLERPRMPSGRVRWITPAEAERLLAACSEHLRPLVLFMLYTGARMSEALYLDWNDVDLTRAHVSLLDTKNGESRGVPLHPRVVAALANLEGREGMVFRRPDGEAYRHIKHAGGQIKTAFNGACRRAGIENFTPHDCRHTWATWYYAEYGNLAALMQLGGWKSVAMAMRYAHVNTDALKDSILALPGENPGSASNTG